MDHIMSYNQIKMIYLNLFIVIWSYLLYIFNYFYW
jgi:hypothetical protein